MNYIAEINAFYVWLQCNSISGNAQALWHRLMSYCNTLGWKDEFTVTNAKLADELEISRQQLDRIRNVLCQKGLILYKKGSGNQCGTYQLISLSVKYVTQIDTQSGHKADTQCDTMRTQSDTQTVPLNKLNKTKDISLRSQANGTKKVEKFIPPTLEEVRAYCKERKNNIDPQMFIDWNTSKGWRVGKVPMKDWKAAMRTWEQRQKEKQEQSQIKSGLIPAEGYGRG